MARGRKPKPAALKVLAGERADRIPASGPVPSKGRPPYPILLEEDEDLDAHEGWNWLCDELEAIGLLTPADGPAIALFADAYGRLKKARREIAVGSITSATALGGDKSNPAVAVAKEASAQMLKILVEFGLTPSSRSRIKLPAEEKVDPLAEFLRKA